MRWTIALLLCVAAVADGITPAKKSELLGAAPPLDNVLPALEFPDHQIRDLKKVEPWKFPIAVPPFEEHVRGVTLSNPAKGAGAPVQVISILSDGKIHAVVSDTDVVAAEYELQQDGSWSVVPLSNVYRDVRPPQLTLTVGDTTWMTGLVPDTTSAPGLYGGLIARRGGKSFEEHNYGINGPLSSSITGLAADSTGALWVGTPIGLSKRQNDGRWTSFRGTDGLPYEHITCLAVDKDNRLWIGTSKGVVQFRPYEEGRQWFYRQGQRYLPDDHVTAIAVSADAKTVYVATPAGIGTIEVKTTTLLERAQTIEKLVNERHRRLGMVADCQLDDALNPTSHTIGDNDNDGLWTAYHVAAMSLAYGTTKDPAAKESAKESMHSLYMLQNASGVPGLVARSVLPPEEGSKRDANKPENKRQWRPTPDGKMYWKSDTSSDEIDGHFLAFYVYYEHVAQYDPQEKALCAEQCKKLIDYLIKNNYQLIDWNGERTRWGFWNPENLNGNPRDFTENGLNALQMLSFLRTSYFVTGDKKYLKHYKKLIMKHHYLSNVLLSKKEWPDENNHSDDQLGYVAWYPILQLEKDPVILRALTQAVRRHYRIVWPEKPSFYAFVTATVDPQQVAIDEAIENLKEIPTDRRTWRQENSHRADVEILWRSNRFGKPVITRVVPADERCIEKWNGDPYEPDDGGDGRNEDDGAAYLLPYWMGRYHGFIAESN